MPVDEKTDDPPVALEEPDRPERGERHDEETPVPWLRGLQMLVFAALIWIVQWVLIALAVLQFAWMAFDKKRNEAIAEFGENLAAWLARAARFQTGASDDKPFPWSRWGK